DARQAQNRAGYVQDPAIRRPPVMRPVDLDELQSEGSKRAAKGRRKKAWGTINRWSVKHNWIARAAAWDREVDEFVRERQRDEIARMRPGGRRVCKGASTRGHNPDARGAGILGPGRSAGDDQRMS